MEKVYTIMTENTKLSTVYNKCVEFVKEKRPDWLTNFPKNIGFGEWSLFIKFLCSNGVVQGYRKADEHLR